MERWKGEALVCQKVSQIGQSRGQAKVGQQEEGHVSGVEHCLMS